MPESAPYPGWSRNDSSYVLIAKVKGSSKAKMLRSAGPFKSAEEALAYVERRATLEKDFRKLWTGCQFMAADASALLEINPLGAVIRYKDEVIEVTAK